MTCWMGVASAEHTRAGRDGRFAQLGHGKHEAVKSLKKGDWIVYYSPREEMRQGVFLRAFTSIGRVISDAPYQVEQKPGFFPHRVDVDYLQEAIDAPIKPLLNDLTFTRDLGANWGIAMRMAKRRLDTSDFRTIALAMGVEQELVI